MVQVRQQDDETEKLLKTLSLSSRQGNPRTGPERGAEWMFWSASTVSHSARSSTLLCAVLVIATTFLAHFSGDFFVATTKEEIIERQPCHGKDPILAILSAAGVPDPTHEECKQLPTWSEVTSLYGEDPVVYGLDTCSRYRQILSAEENNGTAVDPMIRVAGLLNTGTHALSEAFDMNVKPWDGVQVETPYQVPWGKHLPARYKWKSTIPWYNNESKSHVLPIVIIKDPFRWMASMCKASYMVRFEHVLGHCPNLVRPSTGLTDNKKPKRQQRATYNVTIPYWRSTITDEFDSLADLWTEWYRDYINVDYPRLIVRYEDFLFRGEEIMDIVTACAGTSIRGGSYQYRSEPSKPQGYSSDLFAALKKYGSERGRYTCLTQKDVDYVKKALDPALMELFRYSQVPESYQPPASEDSSLLCPGMDPNSKTGWMDRRATYTEQDYMNELIKRPWRRPAEKPPGNFTRCKTAEEGEKRKFCLKVGRRF